MNATYQPATVTIAAIAYEQFGDKMAVENLEKLFASENMDIALMAVNYILYVNNKQMFIQIVRSVHGMKGRNYNV